MSWPLVTLRRFGFYGNSLFKVETGRRAPRGEGLYLFRIKHLREFRKSFEIVLAKGNYSFNRSSVVYLGYLSCHKGFHETFTRFLRRFPKKG
ncbi:unnamed protein product [Schistosoma margrebowiei]|uniref:IRS-type PTB domain-containing protein n=1 Tax=Schistosoma margrebowiei TaxID=48269 RepID=A0A3P7Z126_9TREM|nr:unnamed protein product [Schistosoma margrebowiei]